MYCYFKKNKLYTLHAIKHNTVIKYITVKGNAYTYLSSLVCKTLNYVSTFPVIGLRGIHIHTTKQNSNFKPYKAW